MKKFLRYSLALMMALIGTAATAAETTVTFDPASDTGTGSSTASSYVVEKDGVKFSVSNGLIFSKNDLTYYRIYKEHVATFEITSGTITAVKFTCTASGTDKWGPGNLTLNTGASVGTDKGSYSYDGNAGTWTGNATTVCFTASGSQVRATLIEVTIVADGETSTTTVAAPTITPSVTEAEEGTAFTVAFSHTDAAATIYYTTDGTTPTTASTKAAGDASLTMGTADITIKAIAEVNGTVSAAATATVAYKAPTEGGYTVVSTFPYEAALTTTDNRDDFTLQQDESVSFNVWSFDSKYGAKASAYRNNTKYASEAWFLTPIFDLTNVTSPTFSYDEAGKFFGTMADEATVWVREGATGEWQQVTLTSRMSGSSWTYVNSGDLDLSAYVGKKIQIGFKYVSTTSAAGTWEIKNFKLNATATGIVAPTAAVQTAAKAYTLSGMEAPAGYRGIVIINGKKYLRK